MVNFAMQTPHEQLVTHKNLKIFYHDLTCSKDYNIEEHLFIKDLWNQVDYRW